MIDLSNEIHPVLNKEEMAKIQPYREKLAYKSDSESIRMLHRWARSKKMDVETFGLLMTYYYQGY